MDGVTGGATIALLDSTSDEDTENTILVTGVGAFALGTPIVHFAHGHTGKGVASLAIRGGSAGALALGASNRGGTVSPLLLLGFFGLIAAIPIDAAVFAREDVPPEQAARTSLSFRLAPTLAPAVGAYGLSVAGGF
jgi:hypothetical protein